MTRAEEIASLMADWEASGSVPIASTKHHFSRLVYLLVGEVAELTERVRALEWPEV